MLKSIIIDDQIEAINSLKQDVQFLFPNEIQIIGQSTALDEAVVMFKEFKPDLIFLDIDLKIGTGFDFLKKISKFEYVDYDIIFITAFNQFAIKAIKYSAFDYLLKPIDRDELEVSINRLQKKNGSKETKRKIELVLSNETKVVDKRIALPTLTQTYFVIISDIIRCKASHNYTTFHMNDGSKIMVSKTLKEYESILTEHQFIRIHQSHLVNLKYVTSLLKEDGGVVLLKNGEKILVSRRKKENLIQALKQL